MGNINNIDNKEKYEIIKKAKYNLKEEIAFSVNEIIKSEIVSPLDACTCTENCGSSFGNGGFQVEQSVFVQIVNY